MELTDQQLDSKVEECDLPDVSACFDNTDDYLEKLGSHLNWAETDVKEVKSKKSQSSCEEVKGSRS